MQVIILRTQLDQAKLSSLRLQQTTDQAKSAAARKADAIAAHQAAVATVGQLQLEVLLSRLDAEYKVAAGLEPAPFETARWLSAEEPGELKAFADINRSAMAKDRDGNPVFLAKSAWEVGYVADRYPGVTFAATRER